MLYKYCTCGKLIEYATGKCPACKAIAEEKRKAWNKERKRRYRENKEPDKEMKFYNTASWQKLRNYIVANYMNMSVYSYCKEGKIVPSEVVHHLVEVRDSWDNRLNKDNLIPVTRKEHIEIHKRIELEGKEKVKEELSKMLEEFRTDFKIEI